MSLRRDQRRRAGAGHRQNLCHPARRRRPHVQSSRLARNLTARHVDPGDCLERVLNFQADDPCRVTPEASELLACSPALPSATIPRRLLGGEAKRNHRKSASTQGCRPSGAGESGACIARAPAGVPFVSKRSSGGFATLHHRLTALVLSGRRVLRTHLTHRSS